MPLCLSAFFTSPAVPYFDICLRSMLVFDDFDWGRLAHEPSLLSWNGLGGPLTVVVVQKEYKRTQIQLPWSMMVTITG